ncbi:MAG: hypothetical protein ACYC38_02315 [Eubacteriales bacterium]
MAVQYYFEEGPVSKCILITVPVVAAEADVEVVVDSTMTLPELAQKVDKIIASVRDLRGTPVIVEEDNITTGPITFAQLGEKERGDIVKKIVVSGTLHKQIFYLNTHDQVKHTSEDVTFSKLVELKEPRRIHRRRSVFVDFKNIDIDVNFELQRASRLHQTAVLSMTAKAVEDRQLFVQTCPKPKECPAGNLVRDGAFEAWADPFHPVFWGASNVAQTATVHSGSFAAEVGIINPLLPGSLFQMVRRGTVGGRQYRLTFWVKEDVLGGAVSNFSLTAEVVFFDESGAQIGIGSQSLLSTAIPDTAYSQVQFVTPLTDESVHTAMVRFNFTPGAGNTNSAKIDDVMLECTPVLT